MSRPRAWALCWHLALAASTATAALAMRSYPVLAQDEEDPSGSLVPNPGPDASIPGSSLIIDILGWLKYGALASAVAGLLIGGIATAVGYTGAHYGASSAGRRWLLGGIGAAVITGLAHMVVVTLYEAAK